MRLVTTKEKSVARHRPPPAKHHHLRSKLSEALLVVSGRWRCFTPLLRTKQAACIASGAPQRHLPPPWAVHPLIRQRATTATLSDMLTGNFSGHPPMHSFVGRPQGRLSINCLFRSRSCPLSPWLGPLQEAQWHSTHEHGLPVV